jgi:short-chain 2-methylacyl-CoA dehydrogenase
LFIIFIHEALFRLLLKFSTKVCKNLPTSNRQFTACIPGRIGIAAQMLGLAQGAFDKAVPYTYERKQFGQPVGTFQGMQFSIAEAAVAIETARLLTYNAARLKDEGQQFTSEAAMAKYWASVVAQRVSGNAIEWAGGVGFTRETGIEKFWRDSKIVSCIV